MNYIVSAWLEQDGPRLGILCSDTGQIKQQWSLDKVSNNSELGRRNLARLKRPGIQQLTRELFLVGCAQEIGHLHEAQANESGNICLYCNQCVQGKGLLPNWRGFFNDEN